MKIKFLQAILLILSAISILLVIFKNHEKLATPYDHAKMGSIYSESQYIKGPKATVAIGDDGLFAVAGFYLLIQGGDPSQIHFEGPPLGEYLIGLSILLFHNEFVISIFYGILLLLLTYKLGYLLFDDQLVGILAIFFISFDQLFLRHLHASLLDLPQSLFVTASIFFFIRATTGSKKYLWISSFFLSLSFATKFFPGAIFIIGIFIYWLWKNHPKKLLPYIYSLFLIPIIYLLSYIMFFYHHHSLIEFLRFQKWVIAWRLGNPRVFVNIFFTLLIGRYRSWWQEGLWIADNEWSLISSYIFIVSILSKALVGLKKNLIFRYLYGIYILFLIYLAIGTTGVAKYIYPIYPLMAIFASYSTLELFRKISKRLK